MCVCLRLARLRLQRPDVSRAVSVQSVLQLLLQRWRAEVSCALVTDDAAIYLSALDGRASHGDTREVGPSSLDLYDLRDYRVPC